MLQSKRDRLSYLQPARSAELLPNRRWVHTITASSNACHCKLSYPYQRRQKPTQEKNFLMSSCDSIFMAVLSPSLRLIAVYSNLQAIEH